MTKKLIIIVVFLTVLTSGTLYSCSINNTKQAVVKNVKSVLQTKKDLQLAVIALLAYYSEKYSINPKYLLNNLTKQ